MDFNKKYILFIDSGIGGITILDYLLKNFNNNLNIIYYADVEHFPYGSKSEKTISQYLINIKDFITEKYNVELIVIACNTASVSALDILRSNTNIQVVGTVPAIKLASKLTKNNRIGVIGTETTIKLDYIQKLIRDFANDKEVFLKATPEIVNAIENNFDDKEMEKVISEELKYFEDKNIDVLVLGCTHYSYIDQKINNFFANMVLTVDSRDGVSRRIMSLINETFYDDNNEKILYLSLSDYLDKYLKINERLKIFNEIWIKRENRWEKV